MSIADYDRYTNGGMNISTPSGTLKIAQVGAGLPGNAAASVIKSDQAGRLQGSMRLNISDMTSTTHLYMGLTCLHSTRNITTSSGQFYACVYFPPEMRLFKYLTGAGNVGNKITLARYTVTGGVVPGQIGLRWDASSAGLGGTRLT